MDKTVVSKYCNYGNEFNDSVETNQTGTITISVKVVPTVTTQSSNTTQNSRKPRPTPTGVLKSYNSFYKYLYIHYPKTQGLWKEKNQGYVCGKGGGGDGPLSL